MDAIDRIPSLQPERQRYSRNWQYYLLDTVLAVCSSLVLTGIIFFSRLYPKIPDIIVIYLLLIMPLALWRSRYSALVASFTSALAFDFFLVPPLFMFTIARAGEWIALLAFLVTAIIISHLAGLMRRRADEAHMGQHYLRILYEVLRVCNTTDSQDEQLDAITLSTKRIFSSWGVTTCAILLPDPAKDNHLVVRADAPIRVEPFALTAAEEAAAVSVWRNRRELVMHEEQTRPNVLYLLPLKSKAQIFAVLYLRTEGEAPAWLESEESMQKAHVNGLHQAEFFWTYLDQISMLIERSVLHLRLTVQDK